MGKALLLSQNAWLPGSVISKTSTSISWEIRESIASISISGGSRLNVPFPHLVASVTLTPSGLASAHIVAIKRKGRPVRRTPVFHAPFKNVRQCSFCYLDLDIEDDSLEANIDRWTSAILSQSWDFTCHERTLKLRRDGRPSAVSNHEHTAFWKGLFVSGACRFPSDILQPRRETLQDWLLSIQV